MDWSGVTILAFVASVIAVLLSTATTFCMARKHSKVQKIVQIEFILFLLAGIFLVSLGSLLMVVEATSGTCITSMWAIIIGYTLQLIPLIVKASAIVGILRASKRMRIVFIEKKQLLGISICWSTLAAVYCSFWTAFDPPRVQYDEDMNPYCESGSYVWIMVFYICQAICNARLGILAYKMRLAPEGCMTDCDEIGSMIYTSTTFLIFRVIVYILSMILSCGYLEKMVTPSFLFSMEMITNIFVYFSRFFLNFESKPPSTNNRDSNPNEHTSSINLSSEKNVTVVLKVPKKFSLMNSIFEEQSEEKREEGCALAEQNMDVIGTRRESTSDYDSISVSLGMQSQQTTKGLETDHEENCSQHERRNANIDCLADDSDLKEWSDEISGLFNQGLVDEDELTTPKIELIIDDFNDNQ